VVDEINADHQAVAQFRDIIDWHLHSTPDALVDWIKLLDQWQLTMQGVSS